MLSGKGIPINCRNFRLTNAAAIKLFDRVTEALKLMGIPYENNYGYEIHVLNEQQLHEREMFKVTDTWRSLKSSVQADFTRSMLSGNAAARVSYDNIQGIKVKAIVLDDLYEDPP